MRQSLKMAMKSISGNKFRSFLTMLGIIIGVMALVVLVSLVNGATGTVTDTISSLGNDMISVTVSDDKGNPVTVQTLQEWMAEEDIGLAAPVSQTSVTGKYASASASVQVCGTTAAYADIQGLDLLLDRFLKTTDVDNSNYVCVLSQSATEELVGYADCLGEEISLDGLKFTVVGVLAEDDSSSVSSLTGDTLTAYIPYTTLIRLSAGVSSGISAFYVSAAEGSTVEAAQEAVSGLLMERFENDEDAFSVSSTDVLEDAIGSVTAILEVLLGGIAAISLLVGGIGILLFWGILRLVTVVVASLDMTFKMQANVVVIAVVFCFVIGTVFGLYPANKAAKLAPVDALRSGD